MGALYSLLGLCKVFWGFPPRAPRRAAPGPSVGGPRPPLPPPWTKALLNYFMCVYSFVSCWPPLGVFDFLFLSLGKLWVPFGSLWTALWPLWDASILIKCIKYCSIGQLNCPGGGGARRWARGRPPRGLGAGGGPPAEGPGGGEAPKDFTKPNRLHKAPTDNRKPQQTIQSPRKTIQSLRTTIQTNKD